MSGAKGSFVPLVAMVDLVPLSEQYAHQRNPWRSTISSPSRPLPQSLSSSFVLRPLSFLSLLSHYRTLLQAVMPPPKRGAEHYAHYKANRHILSSTALLQRRRNLRAAIEVLTLLFLGTTDAPEPEIPLRDQNQSFLFRMAGVMGAATLHTSQQAAADLVDEFRGLLSTVTDEQAGNEEWLKENSEVAYAQYRFCENRFNAISNYVKYAQLS